jgi:hypothetical protein
MERSYPQERWLNNIFWLSKSQRIKGGMRQ